MLTVLKKKLFRFLAFIAVGVLLFCGFWKVFHFKYAKALETLYDLPEKTVDILAVGSSHVFNTINPSVLYEENGMSAFVLGSPNQPIWNSYYYIIEALKTQSPKLVIVECYKIFDQEDYDDDPTTVKTVSNMKLSMNRTEAIWNSVGDRTKLIDYFLEFPWFHSRYAEIGKEDLLPYYGNAEKYKYYLGYSGLDKEVKVEFPTGIEDITERKVITEKNYIYLEKICQLSKEKDFDLLFLISPFCRTAKDKQGYYNALSDYAKEREIHLINGNYMYDELHLDPQKDFANKTHLSIAGSEKFTRYLAGYICQHYQLEDHRGDSKYDRWEQNMQQNKEKRKSWE